MVGWGDDERFSEVYIAAGDLHIDHLYSSHFYIHSMDVIIYTGGEQFGFLDVVQGIQYSVDMVICNVINIITRILCSNRGPFRRVGDGFLNKY